MTIKERLVEYEYDGDIYEACLAWDDQKAAAPAVAVVHAWGGRSDFEDGKARMLAERGYVGFALDMYGKGKRGSSNEENTALMTPLMEDRGLLLGRMQRAIDVLREQPEVDASRVAAMGFCFGGLCVLDLARSGSDVRGVVSFHGLFIPPGPVNETSGSITAKVLCLHGYDDPMAQPESVLGLASEMSAAGADWQVYAYGNTMHSFTNPEANDPGFGTVYSADADRRSHQALFNFLEEVC